MADTDSTPASLPRPVRRGFVLALLLGCLTSCFAADLGHFDLPPATVVHRRPGIAGDIRHYAGVRSRILDEARDVWVYLPPGYHDNEARRFPVLYAHDGNNMFDPSTAFLGREWGLDETLERLIHTGQLPPVVVVAVGNSSRRIDEYTWDPGQAQGRVQGGQGERYARFLVEELKPTIDREYRTRSDAAHTAVMGSSLGGLISLYLGLHHAETFGTIGVISPSVWWADRKVLRDTERLSRELRIWVDMGTEEGEAPPGGGDRQTLIDVRDLRRALEKQGYRDGEALSYWEIPGGRHDEQSWSARLPAVLQFVVPADR